MRSILIASTLLISLNTYAYNDFEKALTSYNTNKVDESYIHLKNVLKDDEDNLPAIILMGRVLLKKGFYVEGIEVLQEALFRGADINFILNDLTNALMIVESYDEIINLNSNKNLTSNSQLTVFLLSGNAYSAMGDMENARVYYKKSYNIAPNDLRSISALAAYELKQNNFIEAEKLINKAKTLFPQDSRVWNLKGQLHENKSEQALALQAYEKGYAVNTNDPFIQRALANAYANTKKVDESLKLINIILEITPDDPFAKLLKSRLLSYSSKEEESKQLLAEISQKLSLLSDEKRNSNTSLALVAGTAAYVQNNLELAQKELQFYVKSQPQDISGISLLVDIYLSQNQQEKAFELLESKSKVIKTSLKLSLKLFDLYLQSNKVYKAEQVLASIENEHGNKLQFILAQANLLAKNKQAEKALSLLEEKKPSKFSPAYYLTKGLLLASINQLSQAHNIADELLKIDSQNIDFLGFKVNLLLQQRKWNEALNVSSAILEQSPNNFTALFNSATAHAALSEFKKAQEITVRLIEIQPENISLKVLQAKINRDIGNINEAKKSLKEIIDKNSTYIPALETLMEIYYQQKEYDDALEQVDRLTKLSFLNAKYITMKARIYLALGDITTAKKQLQVLLGVVSSPRDIFSVSQMQMQAKDLAGAKQSLEKALSIEPKNIIIQRSLAKLEIGLGNFSSANTLLNELEKVNKTDPNLLMLKGDLALQKGNKVNAHSFYTQALQQNNDFHIVLLKLYQLALENIESEKFSSTVIYILKNNPKNHLMRSIYADYLLSNGHTIKAKEHYEKLVSIDNLINKASILNNLANIYLSIDLNKAEEYSQNAIKESNNSAAILDTYGWILSLSKKFNESLPVLRKAYSMDSNNPSINYHIAYTLVKLNRVEEAKRELRRALSHKTKFSERKDAEALLNSL